MTEGLVVLNENRLRDFTPEPDSLSHEKGTYRMLNHAYHRRRISSCRAAVKLQGKP